MRRSVIWSALLHFLVLVLAIVGLPRLWDTRHPSEAPMIVEVVNIDKQTTAKDMPKRAEKTKKPLKKAPPPKARPRPAPPPPEPPRVTEAPAPDAEKVPIIKKKPKQVPKKEKKKKVQAAPPAPPRAIARARPRHRPLPPKDDFLQSVLRDVAPEERGEQPKDKPDKKEPAPQPVKQAPRRAPRDAVVTTLEIDAIRHKIEHCWVIPAGAQDADKLVVSIRVWVNPDGRVREARILDQSRMLKDVFYRTAAESALRAVLNPRCSPLPIPPTKYDQFKEFVLDFNPKDAAGS
jgi:hypothetical protein